MRKHAFDEEIPSVFIVQTPLQVLCAVEAIEYFKIKKYKVILAIYRDEVRNDQTINLCKKFGLDYTIDYSNVRGLKWLDILFSLKEPYRRAFIGDLRSIKLYYYAAKNVKNGSPVVCLDDGNDTIFLLNGEKPEISGFKSWLLRLFVNLSLKVRGISLGHDLYTLYGDIANKDYKCVVNDFSYVAKLSKANKQYKGIYFVGTNYARFCQPGNYPLDMVKKGLEFVLGNLRKKNPDERIVYIPHGRDVATFPSEICQKYNIDIVRPKTTIELMLLEDHELPSYIYGFTSTALYNIKMLYPSVNIYNLTFKIDFCNQFIKQIQVVSEYYTNHGIAEIVLDS